MLLRPLLLTIEPTSEPRVQTPLDLCVLIFYLLKRLASFVSAEHLVSHRRLLLAPSRPPRACLVPT